MIYAKLMEFINKAEKDLPVSEWTVGGIHVWPIIRIKIRLYIMYYKANNTINPDSKSKNSPTFTELESMAKCSWMDKQADVVFLTHTGVRTKVEGVWYDRFCDYLYEELLEMDKKSVVLEYTPFDRYNYPAYIPSSRIGNELNDYFNQNIANLKDFTYNLSKYEIFLKRLDDFFKEISYPTPLMNLDWLISRIRTIRLIADYFKLRLLKIKPKVGFAVCYYTDIGFGFVLACRECGVLSVDIQHGGQNYYGCTYERWYNVPKQGYELLPSVFWNWNNEDQKEIIKWCSSCLDFHYPVNGGNPWISMWKKISKKIKYNDIEIKTENKDEVNILYTHSNMQGIDDWILQAISCSPSNWRWWIRFHPLTRDEEKNHIMNALSNLNKNVETVLSNQLPLFAVFNYIDIHVSSTSSSVIEAGYFNIPSVVTSEAGAVTYANELEKGIAVTAYNIDDLLRSINVQLEKKNQIKESNTDENSSPHEAIKKIFERASNIRNANIAYSGVHDHAKKIDEVFQLSLYKHLLLILKSKELEGLQNLGEILSNDLVSLNASDTDKRLCNNRFNNSVRVLSTLFAKYNDLKNIIIKSLIKKEFLGDDLISNILYHYIAYSVLQSILCEKKETESKIGETHLDILNVYIDSGLKYIEKLYRVDKIKDMYKTISIIEDQFLMVLLLAKEAIGKNKMELFKFYREEAIRINPEMGSLIVASSVFEEIMLHRE